MERIGVCPVCHKGQLLKHEDKYQCNYVDENQRFCNFFIYKSYSNKIVSPEMLFDLIHHYETKYIKDFKKDTGESFEASLHILNGFVRLRFKEEYLDDVTCVNCNSKILRTPNGFGCEEYFNKRCGMFIYKSYNGIELIEEDVKRLVSGGTTSFIDGFISNTGEKFAAKLFVSDFNFKVQFDYTIGSCPKCKSGSICRMNKFYGCSNYLSDLKCDFIIWPTIFGYKTTFDDVELLLQGLNSEKKNFTWKDKTFEGYLSINEEFKCIII